MTGQVYLIQCWKDSEQKRVPQAVLEAAVIQSGLGLYKLNVRQNQRLHLTKIRWAESKVKNAIAAKFSPHICIFLLSTFAIMCSAHIWSGYTEEFCSELFLAGSLTHGTTINFLFSSLICIFFSFFPLSEETKYVPYLTAWLGLSLFWASWTRSWDIQSCLKYLRVCSEVKWYFNNQKDVIVSYIRF